MVISQMVQSFEKLALGTNYDIFITADHGQLFDYQGMWGHNNLVLEQAKVPFFVKSFEIKDLPSVISHYQVGKLILTQIGFELKNKNENNNTYYLHGNNIDFPYDFIEYRIENENVIFNKLDNTKNLLPKSSEK